MIEELQALQAKGLIFLIIFGFFVENHLLANTKSSFYLDWKKTTICGVVGGFAISFDGYFFKLTPPNEFLSQILVHFITSKCF